MAFTMKMYTIRCCEEFQLSLMKHVILTFVKHKCFLSIYSFVALLIFTHSESNMTTLVWIAIHESGELIEVGSTSCRGGIALQYLHIQKQPV